MKIAVIGATGRKVMEQALHLGHEVIAVARRPEVIILQYSKAYCPSGGCAGSTKGEVCNENCSNRRDRRNR